MICRNLKLLSTVLFCIAIPFKLPTISSADEIDPPLTTPKQGTVTLLKSVDNEHLESQTLEPTSRQEPPSNAVSTAKTFDPLLDGRDTGADNAAWVNVEDYGLPPTRGGTTRAIRTWTKPYESRGISRKTDFDGSEVWVSYCAILGQDWNPDANMKFPGLSSATTSGASKPEDFATAKGGQGGGGGGGNRSWSARGQISSATWRIPGALGHEIYHKNSTSRRDDGRIYGETLWLGKSLTSPTPTDEASIADNQWHCIKHHAKLNTVKQDDGILETWLDDTLLFSRDDFNLSDNDDYRNISFWLQLYHGGLPDTTGTEHSVFFADFTYATGDVDTTHCTCK